MMKRLAVLAVVAAIGLSACQRAQQPTATTPAVAPDAPLADIAWFDGDLDAAFARAAAEHKLVFLYWGASWCPPCHDLNAHVFSRRDFRQKLQQFVAVHLDGDAPGAQRAGEEFQVLGYPTVVVLTADRKEVARIAGGQDLTSYADVLDLALESVRPLPEVLAGLKVDAQQTLSAADCRRIAWNGWSLDPREQPDELIGSLQLAAERCPADAAAERDRLVLTAADLAASSERKAVESGKAPSARLKGLLDATGALLADRERALRAGDAALYLGEDYFVVTRLTAPAAVAPLREHWFALMDAIEQDPRFGASTQLDSAYRRLVAAKALAADGKVPDDVATRARATLGTFLAKDFGPDTRAGIVNSAEGVLDELGDDAALRTLLEDAIKTSKTPYYYYPDLADLEEKAGNKAQAIALLQKAFDESQGPATRFQWGTLYVNGLLRMSPQDEPRIRAATLAVLDELDGPDRIHARTRVRLDKLNAALNKWADERKKGATLAAVAQRWKQICGALPESDPVRTECPGLIGTGKG